MFEEQMKQRVEMEKARLNELQEKAAIRKRSRVLKQSVGEHLLGQF